MGVVLLPNAKQQFEDGNGVPLAAGSVYMYVPNTSPPVFATTWQDIGQIAENTNPIVLDADGRCIIWGTGIYRQMVYDALGNLVWDELTSDAASSIVGVTQQFAIPVFIEDKPTNAEVYPVVNIPWSSLLPVGLTGSIFSLEVNPTATTVWTLTKNGSSIGTVSFNTSGVPTVSFLAQVTFSPPTDKLRFVAQAMADSTAAGFAATLSIHNNPMTTIYIMEAKENYSPDLVAGFNAMSPTAPLYCTAENWEPGLQYDFNNREIKYCAIVAATDPLVNTTGHVLWDGVNQYANGADINSFIMWNLRIATKNIDTDVVTFNNCFDVGTTVPAGVGSFSTGYVEFAANPTNTQTVVLNGVTWEFVTGTPSGNQTKIQADMFATIRQLSWDLNNSADSSIDPAFYFAYSEFADPNTYVLLNVTYLTPGTGGDAYTLAVGSAGNAVSGANLTGGTNPASDGTWRRVVVDTSASGFDIPALADPYTGDVWIHVESCFLYHFAKADNFVQKISPVRPIYSATDDAVYPLGITSTWVYAWEKIPFGASPPASGFLYLTPRTISSRETALDQILFYAQFAMPKTANGVMSFDSGNPTSTQTVVFDGVTWTFVTSGASGNQTNIGGSLVATLTQLQLDLAASVDASIALANYVVSGTDLHISYKTSGVSGNTYSLGAGTYGAVLSAATLTQGVGPNAPSGLGDGTFDCVAYSDESLVFISCSYTTTKPKNYSLWRFEPPPVGSNGIPTTDGGFTNITPWTPTTGPNTNTTSYYPGMELVGSETNVYSGSMIYFLPGTDQFVILTCSFPQQAGKFANQYEYFFIDCAYVTGLGSSFDYHSSFVTGYMNASWIPTNLAGAAYAVSSVNETNRYLDTTDYVFGGVDYTKRWFTFNVTDVIGGVVQRASERCVFVQYAFVSGSPPAISQFIDEAGWDATYPTYGTYLMGLTGDTAPVPYTVVLNSSVQGYYNNYNYDLYNNDSSLYDVTANAFWMSGENSQWFGFDSYYTPRSLLNGGPIIGPSFAGTGPVPPLMKLSFGGIGPMKRRNFLALTGPINLAASP